jgi:DNA-binding beta-propeller fold protein YncE
VSLSPRVLPLSVFLVLALVGGCSRGPTAEPVVEAAPAVAPPGEPAVPAQTRVHQGLAVEFALAPVAGRSPPPGGAFAEGDDVVFGFTIRDTATGTPLAGARPAAWLVPKAAVDASDPAALSRKVAALIRGGRGDRPELDLNVFYVLALNDDATITVVDPLFGFGGSKLLALVQLPGPGADWAATTDGSRVFVSVPSANAVAVVDTHSWMMKKAVGCGPRPGRVAIHPDGRSLWVADEDGVTVIDAETLEPRKQLRLGRGPHDLALTGDGHFACVANTGGNTVSVVDARSFEVTGEVETGPGPRSPSFSAAAGVVYVAHEADGSVAAVSPERRAVVSRVATEPGAAVVRFAPSTRLGFVLNPRRNRVSVFDPATGRVVQVGETDPDADQLAFTDRLLYVRQRGTPTVRTVPLDQLGGGGKPVPAATFPGGQKPPAAAGGPCLAAAISAAPGDGAVLVANPADRAIYFYQEGLAAPMGSFDNYGHAPRAVLAVDRSLRSRGPGVYETTARLRRPGEYRVLFFVDSPRLIQAFDVTVKADPGKPAAAGESVVVEALPLDAELTAGKAARIAFRLLDARTKAPRSGLADVTVLAFSPGGWQKRRPAAPAAEPGTYAFEFTPPAEGVYYLYAEAPSAGLALNRSRFVVLEAKAGAK